MSSQLDHGPRPTTGQDVRVQDGNLVWTSPANRGDGAQQQVRLDEVLFTLPAADAHAGSIIVCLKEHDGAEKQTPPQPPFQLVALRTDEALPDQLLGDGRGRIEKLPDHLRSSDANEMHVVVSTGSGLGLAGAFWEEVLRPVLALVGEALGEEEASRPSDVVVTEDAHSVRRFARALDERRRGGDGSAKSATVILLSGDGGVVDMLNGGSSPPLPLPSSPSSPLGTGNALFHSLHKPVASSSSSPSAGSGPSPLVLALRTLFLGAPASLPAFRASFSPGAHVVSKDAAVESLYGAIVASYGFHASIVHESDTPEYRVHGSKRFGMVAQDLLRESHPYRARLSVRRPKPLSASDAPPPQQQQQPLEDFSSATHAYILATLRALDNRLRLVHFGAVGGQRTMEVMMKAYDGGAHVGMAWEDGDGPQRVSYEEVDELRVEVHEDDARWRKFCVDGTIVEVPRGGHMVVEKARAGLLRVLVDPRVLPRR
ncbi:hypothetical protein ACCO45_011338 [Purpureocillium lilacinum]|uniref:Uncharacterized protein n=1 Tax=Purpureocillium lilacinum TaxID=33203 RepID=A0ACC4DKB1_PURLI